jgi:hypothetical protein
VVLSETVEHPIAQGLKPVELIVYSDSFSGGFAIGGDCNFVLAVGEIGGVESAAVPGRPAVD